LEEKKHPACNSCWREEALGGTSFRVSDGAATTIKILRTNPFPPGIVDIDFGDTCNMHCIICSEYSSSVWQSMTNKYPFKENLFDESWNKLSAFIVQHQHTLHHVNLHGGEPSVDPGFNKIVDSILALGLTNAINLRIITNGNYSENFKTKFESNIDKLKANTPLVLNLVFSLDATGEEGEFIRGGLNFERFGSNLKAMVAKEVDVTMAISISMLNLENHINILHWLDKEGLLGKIKLKINMVNRPEMFSVANFGNSIHQFLPKWPENMDRHWTNYFIKFEEFVKPQITTTHQPNKIMIQKLLDWITEYNQLANIQSLPQYFQDFVNRLQSLI
jgi:organic radical activating enzyme